MKYALHFGIDKPSYHIEEDNLTSNSSVLNAKYYHGLSKSLGFNSRIRTDKNATSYSLIRNLTKLSKEMKAGDFLFLTYCGHGTSVVARSEFDGLSEILILFDRLFLDAELARCLSRFKEGVFIFIVSNSCLNGTLFSKKKKKNQYSDLNMDFDLNKNEEKITETINFDDENSDVETDDELQENYISGHQFANYLNAIKYYLKNHKRITIPIIHIASSSDLELSRDGNVNENSEFTIAFKEVVETNCNVTYLQFFNALSEKLSNPKPYLELNSNCTNIDEFLNTTIFTHNPLITKL